MGMLLWNNAGLSSNGESNIWSILTIQSHDADVSAEAWSLMNFMDFLHVKKKPKYCQNMKDIHNSE